MEDNIKPVKMTQLRKSKYCFFTKKIGMIFKVQDGKVILDGIDQSLDARITFPEAPKILTSSGDIINDGGERKILEDESDDDEIPTLHRRDEVLTDDEGNHNRNQVVDDIKDLNRGEELLDDDEDKESSGFESRSSLGDVINIDDDMSEKYSSSKKSTHSNSGLRRPSNNSTKESNVVESFSEANNIETQSPSQLLVIPLVETTTDIEEDQEYAVAAESRVTIISIFSIVLFF
jgi:hypothetical protein